MFMSPPWVKPEIFEIPVKISMESLCDNLCHLSRCWCLLQLVPYFVMETLNYPGIPGFFLASLSAGALR